MPLAITVTRESTTRAEIHGQSDLCNYELLVVTLVIAAPHPCSLYYHPNDFTEITTGLL